MAGRWADCWQEQSNQYQGLRLDPCQLPQKIAFHGQNGIVHATLTENSIVVQRQPKSVANNAHGARNNVIEIIPLSSYRGVSAHRLNRGDHNSLLALMLVHQDPSLSIPLLISDNYDDILLDWRLWADLYNLPMMIIDEYESLRPVRECAPLDYFLREYAPLQSLLDQRNKRVKKRFQLRLPNQRLKLRLKLSNRLILV